MKYLFVILLIFKFAFTSVLGEVINNVEVKNNKVIFAQGVRKKGIDEAGIGKLYCLQEKNL